MNAPQAIDLGSLIRDRALICRARGLNNRAVREYAEAMTAGFAFPPVVVFVDETGTHWLADGFHRCAAAELVGQTSIAADIRHGSRDDALLFAANANSVHGLRRTNADKRRAVLLVLGNFPTWSDRKIAEACGCDHKTVGSARAVAERRPDKKAQPLPAQAVIGAPAIDASVARLSKVLAKVLRAWPAERQTELRELVKSILGRVSG